MDDPKLTPTQRLHEVTMAALTRAPSLPECSVTVSRNFKHDYTFEVVVRGPSVTDCRLLAEYEVDALAVKYPAGGAVSPAERVDAVLDTHPASSGRRRAAVAG